MVYSDPTHEKVQFLWTRSQPCPLHSLSPNVLREICLYVGEDCAFVPDLSLQSISVYDVKTRTVRVKQVSIPCMEGASYCFLESTTLLIAGGSFRGRCIGEAFMVRNWVVEELSRMRVGRENSGICAWHGVAYVFGGYNHSCEKFEDRKWQALPDMKQPRSQFTPVLHSTEVWLPCLRALALESFCLVTERFQTLPHDMPKNDFNPSVAFMTENKTLVVLSQSGFYYMYKENYPQKAVRGRYRHDEIEICAPAPAIYYRKQAYFRGKYNVMRFSLETERLRIVDDFPEKPVS